MACEQARRATRCAPDTACIAPSRVPRRAAPSRRVRAGVTGIRHSPAQSSDVDRRQAAIRSETNNKGVAARPGGPAPRRGTVRGRRRTPCTARPTTSLNEYNNEITARNLDSRDAPLRRARRSDRPPRREARTLLRRDHPLPGQRDPRRQAQTPGQTVRRARRRDDSWARDRVQSRIRRGRIVALRDAFGNAERMLDDAASKRRDQTRRSA